MGNVRIKLVKRTARMLVEKFGDSFTTDFEYNKAKVAELLHVPSKKLRNQIAGYVTRQIKRKKMIEAQLSLRQEITTTDEEEYIRQIEGM
ncbi:30S ribosomal protein S17e [Infirmifilum sp. NZ]|uniref:30S ribosomal protein S17e n=1 Tax=Infirmifilum sp. NZ TaxID=2926850 RepID=UPI000CB4B830|nr:30S ribosomal protein S17e [Infirmifilum sp. NZ]PLJ77231.1 MAG: 30S ribosomal protein S17e [Thermofilum sp. NZ13]UNQ74295.1 30S ribosomal protein S17e [Infirmifilum sp. NZ]